MRYAAALTLAGLVLLLLVLTGWRPLWDAERAVVTALHRTAVGEPGWTHANRVLTDWVWDPVTMRLLAAASAAVLLVRRRIRAAAWVATATLAGFAAQNALKALVGRDRPVFPDPVDSAHFHAFPSGHVMTATIVCAVLLVLALRGPRAGRRGPRAVLWALAAVSVLGVGFTRVYLGVHWPADVIAGWLFGGAVAAATAVPFLPPHRRRPGTRGTAPTPEAKTTATGPAFEERTG
ncbi:phosphatase PAP2 family protein [Streptomyces chumphonensis]|uniref:Phosphatase PAP2 family protein n=1 Tax=Streptomyces chumphonensis TaxID=1214925 RepID=A0A927ICL6_9ACTN|nr:phosphatase PAP2 family protein [Streptomyces chumphonensis]